MQRSWLFVPADDAAKLAKAREVPADVLILDWEDAVLPPNKLAARKLTSQFLSTGPAGLQTVVVRLNRAGSREFQDDCDALARARPHGVMLSKCCSKQDVDRLGKFLDAADPGGRCAIFPLVESPTGILNVSSIASASARVTAVAFGAEDFSADMRIVRTEPEAELLYARSALVIACRAAGCEPIDSPCMDFTQNEKLRASARRARNLGFSGKLAIHPAQVPILNELFSPSESEIQEAQKIVESWAGSGAGVVAVDGRVVDEAIVRRARHLLAWADACGRKS